MGYVASLADDLDFDEALEAFLFKTDVRAQLLERLGVGIAPNVINAYIRLIDREMKKGMMELGSSSHIGVKLGRVLARPTGR